MYSIECERCSLKSVLEVAIEGEMCATLKTTLKQQSQAFCVTHFLYVKLVRDAAMEISNTMAVLYERNVRTL